VGGGCVGLGVGVEGAREQVFRDCPRGFGGTRNEERGYEGRCRATPGIQRHWHGIGMHVSLPPGMYLRCAVHHGGLFGEGGGATSTLRGGGGWVREGGDGFPIYCTPRTHCPPGPGCFRRCFHPLFPLFETMSPSILFHTRLGPLPLSHPSPRTPLPTPPYSAPPFPPIIPPPPEVSPPQRRSCPTLPPRPSNPVHHHNPIKAGILHVATAGGSSLVIPPPLRPFPTPFPPPPLRQSSPPRSASRFSDQASRTRSISRSRSDHLSPG